MPKKDVPAIVSAMGVLMALLDGLVKAVMEAGGKMEDLYRLVTPEGQSILQRVSSIITGKGLLAFHLVNAYDRDFAKTDNYTLSSSLVLLVSEGDFSPELHECDHGQWRLLDLLPKSDVDTLGQQHAEAMLRRQEAIPKEWQPHKLFFPKTVWTDADGCHCIPYLRCDDGRWWLHLRRLDAITTGDKCQMVVIAKTVGLK